LTAELPKFVSVSRFPSIKRDISVTLNKDITVAKVLDAVRDELGDALVKVELFDVYRGSGIANDSKSISLSLVLQHIDRTMTDDEAETLSAKARSVLGTEFGAQLRD